MKPGDLRFADARRHVFAYTTLAYSEIVRVRGAIILLKKHIRGDGELVHVSWKVMTSQGVQYMTHAELGTRTLDENTEPHEAW